MKISSRLNLVCAAMALTAVVHAQGYPTRPIQMIIPLQAASAGDVMMRMVTQKMAENIGQQIVIDNQAGAAGIIGAERLARAAPDGYTIGAMGLSVLTFVPNLHRKVPYDPLKSFEPISMVAAVTFVMIVHPSIPARNVKELIALAKANPGQLDFSSGGNGSPQHIAMEMFRSATGISLTHVPYRGATQAALDVLGGRIPVMFTALSIVLSSIREGKVRPLGVASASRSSLLPDVPTVSESGVPGFTFASWNGIYAPQGTPRPIIERLNSETVKAVNDSVVRERLLGLGLEPGSSTPEQLGAETRNYHARMAKLFKEAGIKVE